VETLELLEEMLLDFTGTVLLVSHDRSFLNNVVTSTLAFDPDGQVREYAGGYDDYLVQSGARFPKPSIKAKPQPKARGVNDKKGKSDAAQQSKKLTWNENKELRDLPVRIEAMEAELNTLHTTMADPDFYRANSEKAIADLTQKASTLDADLQAAYARWEDLESRQ
jgi:ATP-binding cassette subfamily F protein uup